MITYVYFKESKIIIAKIDNIEYISDSEKEIRGNSTIKYGGSQDYICLETDSINLNVGDIISLDGLIDHRTYFTKGKDYWFQEQIKITNERNTELQNNFNTQQNMTNSLNDVFVEFLMTQQL